MTDDWEWYLRFISNAWTDDEQNKYGPVEPKRYRAFGHVTKRGIDARMMSTFCVKASTNRYQEYDNQVVEWCDVTYPYKDYEDKE